MTLVIRGAGGFSGPRTSAHEIPIAPRPTGKPDAVCEEKTGRDQVIFSLPYRESFVLIETNFFRF